MICNCSHFSKSAIFKTKIGKKLPRYFQSKSINNTFCVVLSIKKEFSPPKIGRFLVENHVKNVFYCKFVKKQ